ncbi:uncharacterized protein LOC123661435 [Melitaea cinxia]|uniref:uncharacterized protein LOC123661435 n=1 Tax=Melitaea cinxia TaxID=113334 RepID=UPI001E2705B7|nr:uncharacterized protein LOC123661435 [Melitaea cinxia]
MVTLSITIEFYTWISTFTWISINIYLVEPLYLMIKTLAALDPIANLVQVKYRLEVIGDLLEYYYYHDDNNPQVIKDVTVERVWISQEVRKSKHRDPSRRASVNCRDIINHLSKCYMLLIDQSDFINLKYGIRALFNTSNNLLFLASLVRIFIYTIILFCEVHQCEQTYRQIERIIRLIDQLLISKKIGKGFI